MRYLQLSIDPWVHPIVECFHPREYLTIVAPVLLPLWFYYSVQSGQSADVTFSLLPITFDASPFCRTYIRA